jgi:hypothetical protein
MAWEDPDHTDETVKPFSDAVVKITHDIWNEGAKTPSDVRLFAEIAWHWMFGDGEEEQYRDLLHSAETGEHYAMDGQGPAHLIKAVLDLGASPAPASKGSPLAEKIRALMPQVQAALLACTDADDKATKAGINDHDDFPEYVAARKHEDQLKKQFATLCAEAWAMPVRGFEDAVLLAEIAQHKALDFVAHGESDGLIDPACYDLEAYGRLTMAVLALAGKPFNAHPRGVACEDWDRP